MEDYCETLMKDATNILTSLSSFWYNVYKKLNSITTIITFTRGDENAK